MMGQTSQTIIKLLSNAFGNSHSHDDDDDDDDDNELFLWYGWPTNNV